MLQGHLSALDASFLYLETPEMPMHIGGLYRLKLPDGYDGDFYEDFKSMMSRRLHLAPLLTRKLAPMPLDLANPMWMEDDDIDLEYHIRRVALPKPGTLEQLEKYVGRLHSSLLDRSRPLWEFTVIEGLASGELAFYSKVHHSGLDGQAGMKLAATLLDATPVPRAVKPPPSRPGRRQYQLGVGELIGAGALNIGVQVGKLIGMIPGLAQSAIAALIERRANRDWSLPKLPNEFRFGPRTHFNVTITNQRSFAAASLPLPEVKALGKRLGATINDMVLAICSGALRRYLADYGDIPEKSLIAGVPASVRAADDRSQNNQVLGAPMSLATNVEDPLERLAAIRESSEGAKVLLGKMKARVPMDLPSLGMPWLMTAFVGIVGRTRLLNALPPFANVAISNVPGPQTPFYIAGARVLTMYPVSIPVHGIGLNITVQSYDGHLDFGLTACRRAVPDVKVLAGHLADAFEELKQAAESLPAEEPAVEQEAVEEPVAKPRRSRKRPAARRKAPATPAARRPRRAPAADDGAGLSA